MEKTGKMNKDVWNMIRGSRFLLLSLILGVSSVIYYKYVMATPECMVEKARSVVGVFNIFFITAGSICLL